LIQEPGQAGKMTLAFQVERPLRFALKVRTPAWSEPMRLRVERGGAESRKEAGWTVLGAREWRDGDRVVLNYRLEGRRVLGEHGNSGRAALMYGPAVLAYDEAFNPELGTFRRLGLAEVPDRPPVVWNGDAGDAEAVFSAPVRQTRRAEVQDATFVLYADAGSQGSRFQVWMRAPGEALEVVEHLFLDATEARSRPGNVEGSIADGVRETFVVTYDGQPQAEAWFSVTLEQPVRLTRVVYAHGRSFHDGGWFDASVGRPRVQIQREPGADWETVGELSAYPATTSVDAAGLKEGQEFVLVLTEPRSAVGLRVVGRPASGDNPAQAFASCAELAGYEK
jgi:uncharacterized protein